MSADVLLFGRGMTMLRSPELEAARARRMQINRVAAFRRAQAGQYSKADQGMFGSADQLLAAGPGIDPRLQRRPRGGPAVA